MQYEQIGSTVLNGWLVGSWNGQFGGTGNPNRIGGMLDVLTDLVLSPELYDQRG